MALPRHLAERLRQYRARKPRYFNIVVALLCICNASGYAILERYLEDLLFQFALTTVFTVLWFLVIWHFSRGKSWARTLVLISSALSLFAYLFAWGAPTLEMYSLLANALLGTFLLYWLNTQRLREYFMSQSNGRPTERQHSFPPAPLPIQTELDEILP